MIVLVKGLCPQTGRQHGIKNQAAIAAQCKLNVKLIAALFSMVVLFEDIAH